MPKATGIMAMTLGETLFNKKIGYRSAVPQNEITWVFKILHMRTASPFSKVQNNTHIL